MQPFKFPDEKPKEGKTDASADEVLFEVEGETPVEVVDDTPEPDRNREPMKEPPADVTDEELEKYSDSVRKRIQHFNKGYHDERRAKEAAIREREEALRLAQRLVEENRKLQGTLGQGQQALVEQAQKTATHEVERAKAKLSAAHEAGDTAAFVAAQEELTQATFKLESLKTFKPRAPSQDDKSAVQSTAQPPATAATAAPPDPKALAWQQANPWFGTNNRMTAVALEVHKELVGSGINPTSDEYYDRINAEMRSTFPGAFPQEKTASERKSTQVVTPATRSTAPKKIVLTQTQVALARRLGLTNEQYARALAEEMRKQHG